MNKLTREEIAECNRVFCEVEADAPTLAWTKQDLLPGAPADAEAVGYTVLRSRLHVVVVRFRVDGVVHYDGSMMDNLMLVHMHMTPEVAERIFKIAEAAHGAQR